MLYILFEAPFHMSLAFVLIFILLSDIAPKFLTTFTGFISWFPTLIDWALTSFRNFNTQDDELFYHGSISASYVLSRLLYVLTTLTLNAETTKFQVTGIAYFVTEEC